MNIGRPTITIYNSIEEALAAKLNKSHNSLLDGVNMKKTYTADTFSHSAGNRVAADLSDKDLRTMNDLSVSIDKALTNLETRTKEYLSLVDKHLGRLK